jgi:PTS system nitrogen regulatory IIA component
MQDTTKPAPWFTLHLEKDDFQQARQSVKVKSGVDDGSSISQHNAGRWGHPTIGPPASGRLRLGGKFRDAAAAVVMPVMAREFYCMAEDDFDLNSLATYLHLTPAQVEKLASRGKVPGHRINGQWRFLSGEIHEWFEQRIGASSPEELEHVELLLDSAQYIDSSSISRLIEPTGIWVGLDARTRNSVVEKICSKAADCGLLWQPDKFADAIRARENLNTTALENGVALLHPRRPMPGCHVDPFLALAITPSGIPFGGPRGVLTDVFFLIGSTDERSHLRTLARLSRVISTPDFPDRLRQSMDAIEAWQLIHEVDSMLDG